MLRFEKLARQYTDIRLEKACERAIGIRNPTFTSVSSILKSNLDQRPIPQNNKEDQVKKDITDISIHENIRGQNYYQGEV